MREETNKNDGGFRGPSEGENVMEEIKEAEMEVELSEEGIE